jgi:4-hydroxy-3-methylbut-2-enyl diphosphate reductase
LDEIIHYDLHHKEEKTSNYSRLFSDDRAVTLGITAGASCPNNLIEETLIKIFELRGVKREELVGA